MKNRKKVLCSGLAFTEIITLVFSYRPFIDKKIK